MASSTVSSIDQVVVDKMEENWQCSLCRSASAVMFCTCIRLLFLCRDCAGLHCQVAPHVIYDINELKYYQLPHYLEDKQARIQAFPLLKTSIMRSADLVQRCITDVCIYVGHIEMTLRKLKTETVDSLWKKKTEIEESLAEVEATLMRPEPHLRTAFGSTIRACLDTQVTNPLLFDYSLTVCNPHSLVVFNIQGPTELQLTQFPCIAGSRLLLYDIPAEERHSLRLSTDFTQGTSHCIIDNANVLGVGGISVEPSKTSNSRKVFNLAINSRKVERRPELITARNCAAVVKKGDFVYVFGSYSPRIPNCEKLNLSTCVWTRLPDMNAPRGSFQPAIFFHDIYLADADGGNSSIQVFHSLQDSFRTLSIKLPPRLTHNTNCFVVDGELYFLAADHIGKWRIGSSDAVTVTAISGSVDWSSTAAYVVGKEVWLAYCGGDLVKFNYLTNAVIK